MQLFNKRFSKYITLLESPEVWGDDTMTSQDVVVFLYMRNPEGIISTPVSMELSHAQIMNFIAKQKFPEYMEKIGKLSPEGLTEGNIITGRLWLNNEKISIWEYVEGQLDDDNYVKSEVAKILNLLKKNYPINVNNYKIQVTPTLNDNERDFFIKEPRNE